jgi:hypothetical protein
MDDLGNGVTFDSIVNSIANAAKAGLDVYHAATGSGNKASAAAAGTQSPPVQRAPGPTAGATDSTGLLLIVGLVVLLLVMK